MLVFVGANQTKVPLDLAKALQPLGSSGSYVEISGNGKNAVDFHIAFYIGRICEKDPMGLFYIVSKDTGFDPLITHLREKQIQVQRVKDLSAITPSESSSNATETDKIDTVLRNLASRGQSRPRKVKTLVNAINALFSKKLGEKELTEMIEELQKRKYIAVKEGNVSYKLPEVA